MSEFEAFVTASRHGVNSSDVLSLGRRLLADTLGCVVAGGREDVSSSLASQLGGNEGKFSVLGRPELFTSQLDAALVGGVSATCLDLDSGLVRHPSARPIPTAHPFVHALNVMLSFGPMGISLSEALAQLLTASELGARISQGTELPEGMHPHAAQSTVSAAAAAALARGLSSADVIASTQVSCGLFLLSSLKWPSLGSNIRDSYVGWAGMTGLRAVDMHLSGFVAPPNELDHLWPGGRTSVSPHTFRNLGTAWELKSSYFKRHASVRFLHPALDALELIRGREDLTHGLVESVEVRTFEFAAECSDPRPSTVLGAKFSMPYAIAANLVFGETGYSSFTSGAIENETVREVANRVTVLEDPSYSARLPSERPTTVVVHLVDGTTLEESVVGSEGDPERPFSVRVLRKKFVDLVEPTLDALIAGEVFDSLLYGDIDTLMWDDLIGRMTLANKR